MTPAAVLKVSADLLRRREPLERLAATIREYAAAHRLGAQSVVIGVPFAPDRDPARPGSRAALYGAQGMQGA